MSVTYLIKIQTIKCTASAIFCHDLKYKVPDIPGGSHHCHIISCLLNDKMKKCVFHLLNWALNCRAVKREINKGRSSNDFCKVNLSIKFYHFLVAPKLTGWKLTV